MMPTTALVLVLLTTSLNVAYAAPATVNTVHDGDTLSVDVKDGVVNLRLYGIDAPESGQNGNVTAKRFLLRLVSGHPLEIEEMGTDRFGRTLAIVIRKGKESSVNAAMVGNGYAWVNPDQCKARECVRWKGLEAQARRLGLGIWSGHDLVPPWEFARRQRQ